MLIGEPGRVTRSHTASPAPAKNPPIAASPDSHHLRFSGAAAQPARTAVAQTWPALSRSAFAEEYADRAPLRIDSPGSWNGRIVSVIVSPRAVAASTSLRARLTSASYSWRAEEVTESPRPYSDSASRARRWASSSSDAKVSRAEAAVMKPLPASRQRLGSESNSSRKWSAARPVQPSVLMRSSASPTETKESPLVRIVEARDRIPSGLPLIEKSGIGASP